MSRSLSLNAMIYILLSTFKRLSLPEEFHEARQKRLCSLMLNAIGKVVCHAPETMLRFADGLSRALADDP